MPLTPYGRSTDNLIRTPESKPSQLGSAVDAFQGGMYQGVAGVANSAEWNNVRDWANQGAQENFQEAAQYIPDGPQRFEDVRGVGDFLEWGKDRIIENLPQMGAMAAGAGLGGLIAGPGGAIAGAALSGAPLHLGEAYARQQEEGIDNPAAMYGSAAINTGLDILPGSTFVGAARRIAAKELGKGTLARAVRKNVVAEAGTEGLQGAVVEGSVGNMPEFSLQTPEQRAYWSDRLNEAAAGGIVGGAMGAAGHIASYPLQASQAIAELPGQAYDKVTGTLDNFRGLTPEEQEAKRIAAEEERRKFGVVGRSIDPANLDPKQGLLSLIQDKLEQGIPLEPFEQQALQNLNIQDRQAATDVETTSPEDDVWARREQLGMEAYDMPWFGNTEFTQPTPEEKLQETYGEAADLERDDFADLDINRKKQINQVAKSLLDGNLTPSQERMIEDDLGELEYSYLKELVSYYSQDSQPETYSRPNVDPELMTHDTLTPEEPNITGEYESELQDIAQQILESDGDISTELNDAINNLSDNEYTEVRNLVERTIENAGDNLQGPMLDFDPTRDPANKAAYRTNSQGQAFSAEDFGLDTTDSINQPIDDYEGSDFQFLQGEGEEGGYRDRSDATIQDTMEELRDTRYLGTGKLNPNSKPDAKGRKKPWVPMDYIAHPVKSAPYRKNANKKQWIADRKRDLAEYNKSTKRTYKYVPMSEALEKEVIRDIAQGDVSLNERINKGELDKVAGIIKSDPTLAQSFQDALAQRKLETAQDILARSKAPGSQFYKAQSKLLDEGKVDELLDLYMALESKPRMPTPQYDTFDWEDKLTLESERKYKTKDASEKNTSVTAGFIPLRNGNMLDLPKALTRRMNQLRKAGYTKLSKEEIDAHDKPDAIITPELRDLRQEAMASIMAEYGDQLNGRVIDEKDFIDVVGMNKVDTAKFLKDSENMESDVGYSNKEPKKYTFPSRARKIVEVPPTKNTTLANGYIPLRPNKNDRYKNPKVLDVKEALNIMETTLDERGLDSSRETAAKAVLANYVNRLGNDVGETLTLNDLMEKAGGARIWNKTETDQKGNVIRKAQVNQESVKSMFAPDEEARRQAKGEELVRRIADVREEMNALENKISSDYRLQTTPDFQMMEKEKKDWDLYKNYREDMNLKLNRAATRLTQVESELENFDELNASMAKKGKLIPHSTLADEAKAKQKIVDAINADKAYSVNLHPNTEPKGLDEMVKDATSLVPKETLEAAYGKPFEDKSDLIDFAYSDRPSLLKVPKHIAKKYPPYNEIMDFVTYTPEEYAYLQTLGIAPNMITKLSLDVKDIKKAIKSERDYKDYGQSDSWSGVEEVSTEIAPTTRGYDAALPAEGINALRGDERKFLENQQKSTTEKAYQDDRSTQSVTQEAAIKEAERRLRTEQIKARNKAESDKSGPKLTPDQAFNKKILTEQIEPRQHMLTNVNNALENNLRKFDKRYNKLINIRDALRNNMPTVDITALKPETTGKFGDTTITSDSETVTRNLPKGVKSPDTANKLANIEKSINKQRKFLLKNNPEVFTDSIAKINWLEKGIAEQKAKLKDIPKPTDEFKRKSMPNVHDSIDKTNKQYRYSQGLAVEPTPEKKKAKIIRKAPKVKPTEYSYSDKKSGSLIKDTYQFMGETVPKAFVTRISGIKAPLMTHKLPGAEYWMVTVPDSNGVYLSEYGKTRKEAVDAAKARTKERGIDAVNKLIQEVVEAAKKQIAQ